MGAKLFIISAPPSYELMSLKGLSALKECDVVLYDRLVDELLIKDLKCKKIYVGKTPYTRHTSQEKINALIEEKLKSGCRVARLKGGDAAFFSRAKEEVDLAKKLNVDVEWIAGITSASLICEKIKAPLTIRGISNGVVFITGHDKEDNIKACYDWKSIVKLNMTVVVYMGVKNLQTISSLLIKNGKKEDTPIVIGMSLGFADEKIVMTQLGMIKSVYDKISSPAVIVIGDILKYINIDEEMK